MSTPTPYLSTLVLLCSAFPAQAFRVGLALTADQRPAGRLRRVLARVWLPAGFLLVAALVWYVAPGSGVTTLPPAAAWFLVAVALGLAAPVMEIGTGVLVAVARGHRVGRVRLHERWGGAGWPVLGTALAVAVAEEVIFRGVGLHLLVTELGWPAAAAVGLTAVGYGLNHLYFGPLTVLQKSVTGVLLGVLFLASGHSLLVVVVAHGVQNVAILGLARRREVHR